VSRRANTIRSIISYNQPVITTVLFFFQFYFCAHFHLVPGKSIFYLLGDKRAQGAGEVSHKSWGGIQIRNFIFCCRWLSSLVVGCCCGWGWRTTVGTTLLFVSYICAVTTRYSYIVLFFPLSFIIGTGVGSSILVVVGQVSFPSRRCFFGLFFCCCCCCKRAGGARIGFYIVISPFKTSSLVSHVM